MYMYLYLYYIFIYLYSQKITDTISDFWRKNVLKSSTTGKLGKCNLSKMCKFAKIKDIMPLIKFNAKVEPLK